MSTWLYWLATTQLTFDIWIMASFMTHLLMSSRLHGEFLETWQWSMT